MLRAHKFFLYAESGATVMIIILIIRVHFPGIDIIFNLSDHLKSPDFQSRCHNTFMALHLRRNRYEYDKFVWPFVWKLHIGRHARVFQDLVYNDTYKGTHFVDVSVSRGKASIRLPIKSCLKVLTCFFGRNTWINKTRVKFTKKLSLS